MPEFESMSEYRRRRGASLKAGQGAYACVLATSAFVILIATSYFVTSRIERLDSKPAGQPTRLSPNNESSGVIVGRGRGLPPRLRRLWNSGNYVGDNLQFIKEGTETVDGILRIQSSSNSSSTASKTPVLVSRDEAFHTQPEEIQQTIRFLTYFFVQIDTKFSAMKRGASHQDVWNAYHDLASNVLYPWDRKHHARMPKRHNDDSIFLSVASFRGGQQCSDTLSSAFTSSLNPEKIVVGLVQTNCVADCQSGVVQGGKTESIPPDVDCYDTFCSSPEGQDYCKAGQVRLLHLNETETLGPSMGRYFASKLWHGESWFVQIDSHMSFVTGWDSLAVQDIKNAPSKKVVVSHYPPSSSVDLDKLLSKPAPRVCRPDLSGQSKLIRPRASLVWDRNQLGVPRFAAFAVPTFLVANSSLLWEVLFDPFLPWISSGEEIILSARLWTSGYDIFSPVQSICGHNYVQKLQPKFWETLRRVFTPGIQPQLEQLVANRINYQIGHKNALLGGKEFPPSVLSRLDDYSMGTERSLDAYMKIFGVDILSDQIFDTDWCEKGMPPPGFEEYNALYV